MKHTKVMAVLMFVIMIFSVNMAVFAYGDYCYETEDGWHDYTFIKDMTVRHPHEGYRECYCGDRVYFENQYDSDCKKCRKELCEEGIHYYAYDVHYNDYFSGYGKCYCGKKKYFTSYMGGKNWYEPYPGMISIYNDGDDLFIEANHPHREYDPDAGRIIRNSEFEGIIGNCGVCEFENDYYRKVEQYETEVVMYDDEDFYEYDEYEDFWYEDDYDYDLDYDYLEESYDYYDDYDEYDEYYDDSDIEVDEDEEFYEWLEIAKEILGG